MIFNDLADAPKAQELAKRHANLTLLAADGGVIGTIERNWSSSVERDPHLYYPIAVAAAGMELSSGRTKAPKNQSKWLLGDFDSFGKLLTHQLSSRNIEQGGTGAF